MVDNFNFLLNKVCKTCELLKSFHKYQEMNSQVKSQFFEYFSHLEQIALSAVTSTHQTNTDVSQLS